MADTLNITRRSILAGLAVSPLALVPIAQAAPPDRLADLMSALRAQVEAMVSEGSTWTVSMTMTGEGTFMAYAMELPADEVVFRPLIKTKVVA